MAGAKESPRQKMIGMMYLVLTAMLALNVSSEIVKAFITIDEGLKKSGEVVMTKSKNDIAGLQAMLKDPKVAQRAAWANEAATKIVGARDGILGEIEKHKKGLLTFSKEENALLSLNPRDIVNKDNFDLPANYFITQNKADELQKSLESLGGTLKTILKDKSVHPDAPDVTDAEVDQIVQLAGMEFKDSKSDNDGSMVKWKDATFNSPMVAVMAMLTNYENAVKNASSSAIQLCATKIGSKTEIKLDKFMAMVNQNQVFCTPGEKIEAVIAMGAYSSTVKPRVTVDGQSVSVGANGQAVYSMTAPSNSGTKKVTVSFDNDGRTISTEGEIHWEVSSPSATISADATRVFYIGVDNPVSVAVQGVKSGANFTVNGGGASVSGGNGKYNVRVSTAGTATASVTAPGMPGATTAEFRVKRIPNPLPSINGRTNGPMPKSQLTALPVDAKVDPGFLFQVGFRTTKFTVIAQKRGGDILPPTNVSGPMMTPAAGLINGLPSGSTVIIKDIYVSGPDGERKLDNVLAFTVQ